MVALCAHPTPHEHCRNILSIGTGTQFLGSIIAIGAASAPQFAVHDKAVQPSAFDEGAEFGWYGTYDAFVLEQRKLLETQEAPECGNNAREFVVLETNLDEGG